MTYGKRPPLDEEKSVFESQIAAEGVTTDAGEGTGLSLIDAGLAGAGANSFVSMLALIYPGQPRLVDSQDITAFDNDTGEVTVAGTFKGGQVSAGVPYKIVTFRFVPAEVAAIEAKLDKMLFSMDFWSDTQEELQVTSGATTETLPSVTIADLPGTATIVRAIAMFKFRMVENTYAGVNAINAAQHIQVQKAAGTWRDAISIVDTLFTFAEAAREGGDVLIGDHNIVVEVDANAVYNFQWLNADSLQDFIQYNDIQVGLRIWYSV